MHHKRGKPKNSRSGCLLCKPHKANGITKLIKIRGRRSKTKLNSVKLELE